MKKLTIIFLIAFMSPNSYAQDMNWLIDNFAVYLNNDCNEYLKNAESIIKNLPDNDKKNALTVVNFFKTMADCNDAMGCSLEDYNKAVVLFNLTPKIKSAPSDCISIYEIKIGRFYYKIGISYYDYDIIVNAVISTTNEINNFSSKYKFGIFKGRIRVFESNSSDRINVIKSLDCNRANPF